MERLSGDSWQSLLSREIPPQPGRVDTELEHRILVLGPAVAPKYVQFGTGNFGYGCASRVDAKWTLGAGPGIWFRGMAEC